MKYLSKIILFFVFGFIGLFATAPDTAWTRNYGGTTHESGSGVQQTSDGGYIIVGEVSEENAFLIKTNSTGDSLWSKTYGGSCEELGSAVQQTSDGGYIVCGTTCSFGAGYNDVYLVKTDTLGDSVWAKTYGGTESDYGYSVRQTSDGGYILTGETQSFGEENGDVYLVKTDSTGDSVWAKIYGGAEEDYGFSVQQTSDGGYIVAGATYSFGTGESDVYLIKTDTLGDSVWAKTYGGNFGDYGYSVQQTSDGGYIVTGATQYEDIYLIKTDSTGDSVWAKIYGGDGPDFGRSVQQTSDGGYIVAGYTSSFGIGGDVYLINTDSIGDSLWTKTCGGASSEFGYSVQQTSDGGYIVVGLTYSFGTGGNVYLIKLKPEEGGIEEEINTGLFSLSPADPNPFTTRTTILYELSKETDINISVYNMLGQNVRNLYSGRQSSGTHEASWNGTGNSGEKLSAGIYFLKLEAEGKEASRKVTFLR